jgi:predicted aspartyl protease
MTVVRYLYNRQVTPPALFIHATCRCPKTANELSDFPAQLDTGSDRTVIPARIAEELNLVPVQELLVAGLGGEPQALPSYLLDIEIRGFQSLRIEVVAHQEEPYVLLGRDVLNHFRILLDGPNLAFEIE